MSFIKRLKLKVPLRMSDFVYRKSSRIRTVAQLHF